MLKSLENGLEFYLINTRDFHLHVCIYIYIYTSKKWIMRIKGTLFRTKRDQGKAGVKFESCYF